MKTQFPRPEDEVLVCCARARLEAQHAARIRARVAAGLDWTRLRRAAVRHGLLPLVNRHLHAVCPEAVPAPALQQLERLSYQSTCQTLILTAELLRLLQLFESHGIAAVPFKGPVLAASLYGDFALRQFDDLDLLVREPDALKAQEVLREQAYRPLYSLPPARKAIFRRREMDFVHADGRHIVELHWGIVEKHFSFAPDLEGVWKRLRPVSLEAGTVLSLSPEDSLLTLCLHGFCHLWERLGWICDIAEQLRLCAGMDWGKFLAQAAASGCRRMVLVSLNLACELLGAAAPDEVLREVGADAKVAALTARVRELLFQDGHEQASGLAKLWVYLRVIDRARDRLRYCLDRLTPTWDEWDLLPLPPALFPLYYVLRPLRLAATHTLVPLKRLAGYGGVRGGFPAGTERSAI